MTLKRKTFPDNPFLPTFATIAMVDGVVIGVAIGLAIWQTDWVWYALGGGLLLSIAVFVLLNKRNLSKLSCPHCHQPVKFEAGEGFVCKKCKTCWELT